MKINIHKIEASSFVDGPGQRAVLFVQGCTLACPGCQSRHTWPLDSGRLEDVNDVAQTLASLADSNGGNVTISGGEIMLQADAIASLVIRLRQLGVEHIVAYTGFTWENLHLPGHPAQPYLDTILSGIDVLVDGPFIKAQDDDFITYRGSRNQRVIDTLASMILGELVVVDWDNEIQISPDGALIMPIGFSKIMSELGNPERSRMCGESR